MQIKKVISVRKFKAGYEIREQLYDGNGCGGKDFVMKSAFTPSGNYIGNPRDAYRLCYKRGIAPELRTPDSNVCSIGYCKKERKWYGWSHRAIYGFRPGSKCRKGDCHYRPKNKREFIAQIKQCPEEDKNKKTEYRILKTGVRVKSTNNDRVYQDFYRYPKKWGRGEWTAKTMEDAKQMAMDFADGVS